LANKAIYCRLERHIRDKASGGRQTFIDFSGFFGGFGKPDRDVRYVRYVP
jgi:hypothetical protein